MNSAYETDNRARRVAMLRATFDAASRTMPADAIAARSRALLDLVLSLLEGPGDEPRLENRDS